MERLIRKTTAEQVAERIEVAIYAGEFEPGGRLPPEHKLAAILGVSRITLREGIQRLVARGILVAVPGLGTFVASTGMSRSMETLPSIYFYERVAARKLELLKQFLLYRRMVTAEVLPLACVSCTRENMEWIEDSLSRMSNFATYDRDVFETLSQELRMLQCAAEKANVFVVWLNLNAMRDLLRAAGKDLAAVASLERLNARAQRLQAFLEKRDATGLREYVRTQMEAEDLELIRALEAHLSGPPPVDAAKAEAAVVALAKASTSSSTPNPLQTPVTTGTRMKAIDPPAARKPQPTNQVRNEAVPAQPAPAANPAPLEPAPVETPPLDGWKAEPDKYPRTDPRAWHPWFYGWCQRNLKCKPWEDPELVPPGDPSPYEE